MNASDRPILDEFGKLLIEHVRDHSIHDVQRLVSGKLVGREQRAMHRALEGAALRADQFEVVGRLLANAIETTMANFLNFLHENEFGVVYRDDRGREHDVQAMSDGLAGELYSEAGWIAKFSEFKEGAAIEKLS
jgi:hypothetical protein